MERLILKKGKELESERRAESLRDSLEQETIRRIRVRVLISFSQTVV